MCRWRATIVQAKQLAVSEVQRRWMETKSHENICLFVRDEQTRRIVFNAKALQVLGIDPNQARERGYPMDEQSTAPEEEGLIAA
jgi:hypothetical protein